MNKYFVSGAIIISLGLFLGFTVFKVVNIHNKKLLLVEEKYIIEKARDCVNQKKCSAEKGTITLKELYDLKYLEPQVNRTTKEKYNELSYIKVNGTNYEFFIVN